jgi:hypothetical protein
MSRMFNPKHNISYWVKCDTFFAAYGKNARSAGTVRTRSTVSPSSTPDLLRNNTFR